MDADWSQSENSTMDERIVYADWWLMVTLHKEAPGCTEPNVWMDHMM